MGNVYRRSTASHLTAVAMAICCSLIIGLLTAAPASALCPNEVFRNGPSAKLPDCRAYELVSPAYTGGIPPEAKNFINIPHAFDYPLITDAADSVVFNTVGGALSGTAGNGWVDRYRSKRTANGWVTEFIGVTAEQAPRADPGGVSADHQYYFIDVGQGDFSLEPEATLQEPFGGLAADFIHKPDGEFELIGVGSLGSARRSRGLKITPGASHIVFSTKTQLEPEAPPTGTLAIYDRSIGGPTHVVSLLPGDVTPTSGLSFFLGLSEDASEVAFSQRRYPNNSRDVRFYVRTDNTETEEVARDNGVVVGKELVCEGSGGTSATYQWLRNGTPIPGASDASYTVAPADAGSVLQCQATVSNSEGTSVRASVPPLVAEPYVGKNPPYLFAADTDLETGSQVGPAISTTSSGPANSGFAEVGESLTCDPGSWSGSPSPTFAYRWFREGVEIAGANSATYVTVGADAEKALQCRVIATNADGAAVAVSRPLPVHPTPAATTALPAITNTTDPGDAPEAGDQLSCSDGAWTETATFSYQWLRDGIAVAGATSSTYTVVAADEGKTLQCVASATSAAGVTQAISSPATADPQPGTAPPLPLSSLPLVEGASTVDSYVFCRPEGYSGGWSGEPTFTYRWLRDGAPIAGETNEYHVLAPADIGSVIQCEVTATNAGGSTVAINSDLGSGDYYYGPLYATAAIPVASADLPPRGLVYGGIFGGHLFYSDGDTDEGSALGAQNPADLYSYDPASGTTTAITDVGDALFSHVSQNGMYVYFVSESEIDGQGTDGEPNLYVWSRADDSTTFIANAEPQDLVFQTSTQGRNGANLANWTLAMSPEKESDIGRAISNTWSAQGGSVFLFETTAQLTSFNNVESTPGACGDPATSGDRCVELYLYDGASEELTCVSCPPQGLGPATGDGWMHRWAPSSEVNLAPNLSLDGTSVVFESTEDLLPQDGNETRDVYRWRKGEGLALISTGQEITASYLYGITPNHSDIAFMTGQKLVPEDQNGGTARIYDARVNGGFPPPESTVTEPCSGDPCQGTPSSSPEAPGIASGSLKGAGNVKQKVHCPKGKRRVVRKGKERCVKRKHPRKHHKRRAAR